MQTPNKLLCALTLLQLCDCSLKASTIDLRPHRLMKLWVSVAGQERLVDIELKSSEPCLAELRDAICVSQIASSTESNHQIRLLAAGKLLEGSQTPLSSFGDVTNSVIHCVISDRQDSIIGTLGRKGSCTSLDRMYPPCRSLPVYTGHHFGNDTSRGRRLLGQLKARLSQMFHVQSSADVETHRLTEEPPTGSSEQDGPTLINLNEIEDNQSESVVELHRRHGDPDFDEGTFTDWTSGFTYGFFLGLIMLLLAMDSTIALPRQWVRGVQIGVAFNFMFGTFLVLNKFDI
jgi:hypothetical protein